MTELIWDGKYDQDGKRVAPLRIALPFQTVETVNESAQARQRALDLFNAGRDPREAWRNRLIWGDKKYVLPSLLDEFAGKVNLIYIDPPFNVGADFSFTATIPSPSEGEGEGEGDETTTFTKEPSVIEMKAYRDTWGRGMDSYLQWFYETVVLLRELLAENGSIWVHLDEHIGDYAKVILDEIFGYDCFANQIVWHYPDNFQGNVNRYPNNHNVIYTYVKSLGTKLIRQKEKLDTPIKRPTRVWDKDEGKLAVERDEEGKIVYKEFDERWLDDVWRIPQRPVVVPKAAEYQGYPTQKPEKLLELVILSGSNENDLVLDCFVGSGTTAAVAEKLNRRWIACDLSRFAIHTTRKRLLSIENVRPFVVQNLGKYERQAWQAEEFKDEGKRMKDENSSSSFIPHPSSFVQQAYREFILRLYNARAITGYTWLHGLKGGRMVHVGAVDAPVSVGDVQNIVAEFKRAIGTGKDAPAKNGVDVLGWDFAFELNEVAKQQAAQANINLRFMRIPRDVMDKKAVEQGDIRFFELAALEVDVKKSKRDVTLTLTDFVIPPDDVPQDVQRAIKHWSQWIDYWAVDWDNKGDTFHNECRRTARAKRAICN